MPSTPKTRNIRIFIGCHEGDLKSARKLYQALKNWNIDPWLAQEDIPPGVTIESAYRQAVESADFFLACLSSRTANQRGTHQKYFKTALDLFMQKLEDDIYFIPVRLNKCDLPDAFKRFQSLDLYKKGSIKKLIQSIALGAQKYGLNLQRKANVTQETPSNAEAWPSQSVKKPMPLDVWPFACRNRAHARYFIEINSADNNYSGCIHQGDPEKMYDCKRLQLAPDDTILIKNNPITWGQIVQAIITFDKQWLAEQFDDRGQYEIGAALFKQLFGDHKLNDIQPENGATEIRIITGNEHIARLPWPLLAHGGIFLSTVGWSVTLAGNDRVKDALLPSSPKLLIAAPQPANEPSTSSRDHIVELRQLLSDSNAIYQDDQYFRVVRQWRELKQALREDEFHIFYFYGHGTGDSFSSRLLFEDENGQALAKPVADLTPELRNPKYGSPILAYINCCLGDAGGFLGAGIQLSHVCAAVLTNRTIAYVKAARSQALSFWHSVILKGLPPHLAVAKMLSKTSDMDLSLADPRWMTPILHGCYADWRSHPPKPKKRLERDPHWRLKLDRVSQFSRVFLQTYEMLLERRPKILGYLWYGAQGQGVKMFHDRLKFELQEKLKKQAVLYEVAPDWPPFSDYAEHAHANFETMMRQGFQTDDLHQIPQRIRDYTEGMSGKQALVYIRHRPVDSVYVFDPQHLKIYFKWLHATFRKYLPENAYLLVGISYIVSDPKGFHKLLTKKDRLHQLNLAHLVFQILDAMEKVVEEDIIQFVKTHKLLIPADVLEREMKQILAGENYEKVLDNLIALEARIMRDGDATVKRQEESADNDGYESVF